MIWPYRFSWRPVACAAAGSIALLACIACSDSTDPPQRRGVVLEIESEAFVDEGATYLRLIALAVNESDSPIEYFENCGARSWHIVFDPSGEIVRFNDPSWGYVCPAERSRLEIDDVARGEVEFGQAWADSVGYYRPESGEYTLYSTFAYWVNGEDDPVFLHEKTMFEWEN